MEAQMLKGKTAIITGASYGMGQTMAELFAGEGAAVVLTARGQEKRLKEALVLFLFIMLVNATMNFFLKGGGEK